MRVWVWVERLMLPRPLPLVTFRVSLIQPESITFPKSKSSNLTCNSHCHDRAGLYVLNLRATGVYPQPKGLVFEMQCFYSSCPAATTLFSLLALGSMVFAACGALQNQALDFLWDVFLVI